MIKKTREERKITLKTMADALGISPASLSRYERGEPPWPSGLYAKALEYLGLGPDVDQWPWSEHRKHWDSYLVERDPGTTWADLKDGYADFFRKLRPRKTPPSMFRRQVRADSMLEGCLCHCFCEAGAVCAYISLLAMSFPYHPIVNENFKPISMARRAAFVLDGWIFWPQVNLLINGVKVRLDLLGFNGKRWAAVEGDGEHHDNPRQREWDAKRDRSLGFPVLRFTKDEILGGNFIPLLRGRLLSLEAEAA